jgi:hypothetical protein
MSGENAKKLNVRRFASLDGLIPFAAASHSGSITPHGRSPLNRRDLAKEALTMGVGRGAELPLGANRSDTKIGVMPVSFYPD